MSLVATEPQPALAWSFESSNVDYVTNLAPSFLSTVSSTTFEPTYQDGKYKLGMRLVNTISAGNGNTWGRYNFTNSIVADTGITLACWVNYTTLTTSVTAAVTLYDTGSPAFANTISIGLTTTASLGYINGGATYRLILTPNSITGTYVAGTWYHLAVTFTSTSIIGYINGVASTPKATGATGLSFAGMRIGTYTNGLNNNSGFGAADCVLDDLRVYNTALTAAQVLSVYNQQGVPGRAVMTFPMPTGPASIIGNVVSSNVYTAGRQPDISVAGQTTYSNVAPTFTTFGTTIPLTPTTTGLTVSTYFAYTAAPYGGEGLWSCRLTSDTSVCVFARQTNSADAIFGAYNANLTSSANIPQVSGYNGNRAAWTAGRKDHIVFTFTNTAPVVGRMYVNGVLNAGPVTSSNVVFVPPDGNYTCYVPGNAFGSGDANMSVYDFRIVNATLSAADIAIMYRNLTGTLVPVPVPPMFFSGAPLFNQLSLSAKSSAVGAFSLRAINGVTAKAVQIKRSSDSVTQDFWSDAQGNLLTAPITGQLIQNWLGGASGNIVTWYDQSGLGNHASQATAANQPTVTIAPTGPGYVPVFTSPTSNKFLSIPSSLNLGSVNGSYSKSLWTYVTSNVSQFQNFLATSTSSAVGPGHSIGWNFPSASSVPYFSASQNTYAVNLVSTTFALNTWTHLAVTYNNPTQTFIMYRNGVQVYSNTAFTSSFNAGDGALPTNFRIGVGFGNPCNSQNYDVNIFNSALSASDITTLYNSRLY